MTVQPIDACISHLKSERDYDEIIYMSPDGETLNQKMANTMSMYENIIILCGHYKGVDQRVRDHFITKEISIGDYVLSGGELGALVLSDALIRLIPGVLSDETSARTQIVFKMVYYLVLYIQDLQIIKDGKFLRF